MMWYWLKVQWEDYLGRDLLGDFFLPKDFGDELISDLGCQVCSKVMVKGNSFEN